jgi:putative ABC transport system ATP-binding protein
MIELRNLSMGYRLEQERVDVLKAADLTLHERESVAIVGPSGSGKTTLLLLLAGLEHPDSGSVALDSTDLSSLSPDELADWRRDRMGIVFQSFHLVASLSALDNVALPLEIAGSPDAETRARRMLENVGLGHREHHYPAQLSGGEQQRVAIARALVHSPSLVLADEPTGNLDKRTGEKVSRMLFDLHAEAGATLVMATHDEAMARRCDRILHLDDGQLIEKSGDAVFSS